MSRKSPAQILFQRIVRTWISPEAVRRAKGHPDQGPILLRLALIVWDRGRDEPSVYFNEETFGRVETMKFVAARKLCPGLPVGPKNVKGIRNACLAKQHELRGYEYDKNQAILDEMLQWACDHRRTRLTSGLVEQQRMFMKLRDKADTGHR